MRRRRIWIRCRRRRWRHLRTLPLLPIHEFSAEDAAVGPEEPTDTGAPPHLPLTLVALAAAALHAKPGAQPADEGALIRLHREGVPLHGWRGRRCVMPCCRGAGRRLRRAQATGPLAFTVEAPMRPFAGVMQPTRGDGERAEALPGALVVVTPVETHRAREREKKSVGRMKWHRDQGAPEGQAYRNSCGPSIGSPSSSSSSSWLPTSFASASCAAHGSVAPTSSIPKPCSRPPIQCPR